MKPLSLIAAGALLLPIAAHATESPHPQSVTLSNCGKVDVAPQKAESPNGQPVPDQWLQSVTCTGYTTIPIFASKIVMSVTADGPEIGDVPVKVAPDVYLDNYAGNTDVSPAATIGPNSNISSFTIRSMQPPTVGCWQVGDHKFTCAVYAPTEK